MTVMPCREPVRRSDGVATVLLVGAPVGLLEPITRWTGARVSEVSDLESAIRTLTLETSDAVVSALPLTDEQCLTLLMWMAVRQPQVPVVVVVDDLSDAVARAQWFGARAAIARTVDADALAADVAASLDLSPAVDVWDRIAAAAGRGRPKSLGPRVEVPDADRLVTGLFRGLGRVRGLRGTVALSSDGSLLGVADMSADLDLPETVATLQSLIDESHEACTGAGLAELETAVLRTDVETIVVSCCADAATHVHVVTIVAKDGDRRLVELAHGRLRRDVHRESAPALFA